MHRRLVTQKKQTSPPAPLLKERGMDFGYFGLKRVHEGL